MIRGSHRVALHTNKTISWSCTVLGLPPVYEAKPFKMMMRIMMLSPQLCCILNILPLFTCRFGPVFQEVRTIKTVYLLKHSLRHWNGGNMPQLRRKWTVSCYMVFSQESFISTTCTFIFVRFNVCFLCWSVAICESFIWRHLDINGCICVMAC